MDISQAIAEATEAAMPAVMEEVEELNAPKPVLVAELSELEVEPPDEVEGEDEPEEEADDSGLPEGYVASKTLTEGLQTQFSVRNGEEEVETPDLVIEYKANGKLRRDRLDQVVKLAQFGVYNEEKEQKTREVEQRSLQAEEELTSIRSILQEREYQMERLLQDDDFLFAVRDAYEQENSPERRAVRAEKEVSDLRVSQQMDKIVERGMVFYEGEVEPAFDLIAKALPTITPDELAERFVYAMQVHVEASPTGAPYIPEGKYAQVRDYIIQDLTPWAQMVHSKRNQSSSQEVEASKKKLERAQTEAQRAKRQIGQATKPVGRAGRTRSGPKTNNQLATVDDAVASALNSVLSGI